MIILMLASISTWAAIKRHPAGFPAIWFWACLAPTSSFFPIPDIVFEHRLYLAIAGPVVLFIMGCYHLFILWLPRKIKPVDPKIISAGFIAAVLVCIFILGALTYQRNIDYNNVEAMWKDTVQKSPNSARAHANLARIMKEKGKLQEELHHWQALIRIMPEYKDALNGLGTTLLKMDRVKEAIPFFQKTLQIDPDFYWANHNLGVSFFILDQPEKAIYHLQKALRIKPLDLQTRFSLASALDKAGQYEKAAAQLEIMLKTKPGNKSILEFLEKIRKKQLSRTGPTTGDNRGDQVI